jgi:hypothetical protein
LVFPTGERSDRCVNCWIFAFWTGRIRFPDCGHSGALLSHSSCRMIFQGAKGCPRSGMNWRDCFTEQTEFFRKGVRGKPHGK